MVALSFSCHMMRSFYILCVYPLIISLSPSLKEEEKGVSKRTNTWHLSRSPHFAFHLPLLISYLLVLFLLPDVFIRLKQWKGWLISRFLQALNLGMCLSWQGKVHQSSISHQYVVTTCSRLKLAYQNASGAQVLSCR